MPHMGQLDGCIVISNIILMFDEEILRNGKLIAVIRTNLSLKWQHINAALEIDYTSEADFQTEPSSDYLQFSYSGSP